MSSKKDMDRRIKKLQQIQKNIQIQGISRQDMQAVIGELINVTSMVYEEIIEQEIHEENMNMIHLEEEF